MTEHGQPAATSAQPTGGKRPWLVIAAISLPLVVIMGFLSTQTYFQDGVPVFLADWQFGRFGQSLPIFNIAIFVAVAIVIGLLADFLVRLVRRRRRAADGAIDPNVDQAEARQREGQLDFAAATTSADRFARLLSIIGTILVVMALTILVWTLLLPRWADIVAFPEGTGADTRIVQGRPDGRLMVTTVNDVLLYRDSAFFVPVIDPAEPRTIRRFVEFVPDGSWNGSAVPQVDLTKPLHAYRIALPAFMPTLYAGNGYTLAKPYEVLTRRAISIQMPYFLTAAQLGLIGLVVLGAAWVQRRHVKRLRSDAQSRVAADA